MTLTDLMTAAAQLDSAIEIASDAFDDAELYRLMSERENLNAYASHLRPATEAEFRFLQGLIVEYADFISNIPTHEIARLEALEVTKRISDALTESTRDQREERVAA